MSEREQVGWIDELGNCFSIYAWQATYQDDGKGRWKPLYTAPQSAELDALRSQVAALRESMKPFVDLVKSTSGRIPYERLSLANWSQLCKAYDAANTKETP